MGDDESGELGELLAAVARALDSDSVHETLQRLVDLAAGTVPGCEHASICIVNGRKIGTPAASDPVALRLDALQFEVGQGPCLDALTEHQVFSSDDLATEGRWPLFSKRANAETGMASMLGLRLFARERTWGALNLFSSQREAFGEASIVIAALFAALAASTINAVQSEEDLRRALRSRDVIGQAKGILMERHQINDTAAFDALTRASQHLNVRLEQLAQELVASGEEPFIA